jgi:disulfide bond formation protein DsbB
MLSGISQKQAFAIIFTVALATIAGAWIFEYAGYPPCELCLKQRLAYYLAIPISLVMVLLYGQSEGLQKNGMYVLALIMLASCIFGIYHAGVEWKFWAGPTECTGDFSGGLPDLTKTAVMCDQAALRIFGISLAGYNAIISAALSIFAFGKAHGSSSVSQ